MTDNARDKEAAMLECCVQIATATLDAPRTPAEANVCRAAGMILSHNNMHDARRRLDEAATAYFAAHPSELLESGETVRRGWIVNLPRLRDRLERRLREVGQEASP